MWQPRPLDTNGVRLPSEIVQLVELLAENAHDTWARRRLQDGWRYGPMRNDEAKTHPMLVPYEELPESEKEYDRDVAVHTLKAIVKLGYRVLPPVPDAAGRGGPAGPEPDQH